MHSLKQQKLIHTGRNEILVLNRKGIERMAAYSATKGALVSLTYSWAAEFSGTGIRVNCLAPRAATRMSAVRNDTTGWPAPAQIAPVVSMLLSEQSAPASGVVLAFDGKLLGRMGRPAQEVLATPGPDITAEELRAILAEALGLADGQIAE